MRKTIAAFAVVLALTVAPPRARAEAITATIAVLALPAAGTAPLDLVALGAGGTLVAGTNVVISTAALTSALFQVGVAVGLNFLAQLLNPSRQQNSTAQDVISEAVAPRTRVYGKAKLGGVRVARKNVAAGRVVAVAHCQGPITSFEEFWLADTHVTLDGTSVSSAPWSRKVTLEWKTGEALQGASTRLLANYGAVWTSAHKLNGIAYTVMLLSKVDTKDFNTYFKTGEPQLRAVVKGAKLWDPRNGAQSPNENFYDPTTWTWSDNAGLVILDYLRHPDGRHWPLSRINVDSFKAFADTCGETVALKAGGTEPRYRFWGVYRLNEEPKDVMTRLQAACDAEFYLGPDGRFKIRGGKWEDPTTDPITADMITYIDAVQGAALLSAFTSVKAIYTSPLHDWQSQEADPWVDDALEAQLGPLQAPLQLDGVPSHGQARRLSKIYVAKQNPEWKVSIKTDIRGFDYLDERIVRLVYPPLGIDGTFLITDFKFAGDLSSCTIDLISFGPEAYSWNPATEEGTPPIIPDNSSATAGIPTATIATVTQNNNGTLTVAVTPPSETWLTLDVQVQATDGTMAWTDFVPGTSGIWQTDTSVLQDGKEYEIRARFIDTSTIQGPWSTSIWLTFTAGAGVITTPITLSASTSGPTVTLSATMSSAPTVSAARFYRSGTSNFADATQIYSGSAAPSATVTTTDAPGDATFYYWVRAVAADGSLSSLRGPVSASPTGPGGGGGDGGGGG